MRRRQNIDCIFCNGFAEWKMEVYVCRDCNKEFTEEQLLEYLKRLAEHEKRKNKPVVDNN